MQAAYVARHQTLENDRAKPATDKQRSLGSPWGENATKRRLCSAVKTKHIPDDGLSMKLINAETNLRVSGEAMPFSEINKILVERVKFTLKSSPVLDPVFNYKKIIKKMSLHQY